MIIHRNHILFKDGGGTITAVAEPTTQTVEQQLEEIGTRLAWVRDYL